MTQTRRRTLTAVGSVAAALVATAGYVIATDIPSLAATTANVWLTTPDRANLLTQKAAVTFGTAGSGPVITVDPNTTYQSMVGFGASFTDAAAWNVFNSSQRTNIMNALFNPSSGIGLSFLRQPLGATDFSRSFYTYDDGAADPSLSRFSIAKDQAYILPLVTQARSLNPKISIMGTPWSAPAWMKTNNNLVGGSLRDDQINVYADYLVKSAQAYQAAGAPLAYLSVQNEPQFSPPGYPGMLMSASQQSAIINALVPKLRAAGLSTQLLGWDHNWDVTSYAQQVNSSAGSNVIGSAWHCYAGDPSAQSVVRNAQPAKDIFFTECSGTESGNTFADSLWWQGRNLAIGATRNWARTVTTWNMALDNNHGPVIGSCTNCMGVATVNGGSVTYNAEYYVLGHLSKFVPPGAVRIASTAQNQGGIENVAFRNPDGTIALVALNTGGTQNFQVSYGGQSFGYNLPAGSMATFTWPGTGGSGPTTPPPSGSRTGPITGLAGKCIDVAGGNSANGTAVQLWTCNGSAAQQWTAGTDGTLRALGKCRDVKDVGTANGTKLQIWDCAGGANQRWTATNGTLVAANSGRCLDVTNVSSADGALLQIWDCTAAANQRWTLPS